jgi:hypothetical protein
MDWPPHDPPIRRRPATRQPPQTPRRASEDPYALPKVPSLVPRRTASAGALPEAAELAPMGLDDLGPS